MMESQTAQKAIQIVLVWWYLLQMLVPCQGLVSDYLNQGRQTCQPITLSRCRGMPWDNTLLPNSLGHTTQSDVEASLQRYAPALDSDCSDRLTFLLCALHVPDCQSDRSSTVTLPCKSDCLRTYESCHPVFEELGLSWPEQLDCSQLRSYRRGGCVSPRSYRHAEDKQDTEVSTNRVFKRVLMCPCENKSRKLRKKLYLSKRFHYALRGVFQSAEGIKGGPMVLMIHVDEFLHQSSKTVPRGTVLTLWAAKGCICSRLQPGHEYLFLGYKDPEYSRRLVFDESSMALPWKESWREKLIKWDRRLTRENGRSSQPRLASSPEVEGEPSQEGKNQREHRGKSSRRHGDRRKDNRESARSKRGRHRRIMHKNEGSSRRQSTP